MTPAVIARSNTRVARPLKILEPMIQDDLQRGDVAAERAGNPYYAAAGAKMLEAKPQVTDFGAWVNRKFHISLKTAQRYMKIAERVETEGPEFLAHEKAYEAAGELQKGAPTLAWQKLQARARSLDRELFGQPKQPRTDENQLHRELALKVIDMGYRALAIQMHPDTGGSKDAMRRLNNIAEQLRDYAKQRRFV